MYYLFTKFVVLVYKYTTFKTKQDLFTSWINYTFVLPKYEFIQEKSKCILFSVNLRKKCIIIIILIFNMF